MDTMPIIEKLNTLKKKYNLCEDICLICGAIININFFIFAHDASKNLTAFCIGVVVFIIFASHASKYQKMFRTLYKSVFVKKILSEKFEEVNYDWKRGFTGPQMYNLQLFDYKGHASDDYLKASYKGIYFEQSEVIHSEQTSCPRHNFKGRVMIIKNPFANWNGIWIYTKKFSYSARYSTKALKYVIAQDDEIAEVFDIYVTNEVDVNHFFTPEVKQRLMLLAKKYKAFGVCFKGKTLNIAMNTSRDAFDFDHNSKRVRGDEAVERIQQDVEDIAEVIEILGNIKMEK